MLSGVAETLHPIARPGVVSLLLITTGTTRITGHGSGLATLWEELLPSSVEVVESLKTSLGLTDCTFLAATSEQLELDTDSAESEVDKDLHDEDDLPRFSANFLLFFSGSSDGAGTTYDDISIDDIKELTEIFTYRQPFPLSRFFLHQLLGFVSPFLERFLVLPIHVVPLAVLLSFVARRVFSDGLVFLVPRTTTIIDRGIVTLEHGVALTRHRLEMLIVDNLPRQLIDAN